MINIGDIISKYDKSYLDVATILFPDNKKPVSALNRISGGLSYLTEIQLSRLATFLGISIPELYDDLPVKLNYDEYSTVKFKDCTAILNLETFELKIWKDDEMFHDTVILKSAITVKELMKYIGKIYETRIDNDLRK